MILTVIVAALLFSLVHLRRKDYSLLSDHMAEKSRGRLKVMKPCPICGTLLEPGERVHTVVYSGPSAKPGGAPSAAIQKAQERQRLQESLVHMFGCPYCYPPNRRYERLCPSCKQPIPDDGFVVARMFTRNQRKHVHVLGCTVCRPSAASQRTRGSEDGEKSG